jgi:hypothetical protein
MVPPEQLTVGIRSLSAVCVQRVGYGSVYRNLRLSEKQAVHDASGEEGQAAGDEQASYVQAEHGALMNPNVLAAEAPDGPEDAPVGEQYEQMEPTETAGAEVADKDGGGGGYGHQRQVQGAERAMPARSFAGEKDEPRSEEEGRNDGRQMDLNGCGGTGNRNKVHKTYPGQASHGTMRFSRRNGWSGVSSRRRGEMSG